MRSLPLAASVVAFTLVAGSAMAQEPPPPAAATTISAAALIGYGLGKSDFNPYKLGFGARAGVSLPMGLYLGGTFIYHLGESKSTSTVIGEIKTSVGVYYFGGEVGYNIDAAGFVIRPYLGVGLLKAHAEICIASNCQSGTSDGSEVYLNPGVTLLKTFGSFFAGVDLRYTRVLTGDGDKGSISAPGAFVTAGLNF